MAGCALETALRSGGGRGTEAEVLLRRSRGSCVRLARGAGPDESTWAEELVAVRVVLADGRRALASAPSWESAASVARTACRLARATASRRGGPRLPEPCRSVLGVRVGGRGVPREPSSTEELRERLEVVGDAALAADRRITALDTALARSGVVDSYLASTRGVAVHQRQAACQVHAAVVAREGLRTLTHLEGWAGGLFSREVAASLGERLGRSALFHLTGVAAAPSVVAVLLMPAAVAEMTFAFAPALLGLRGPSCVNRAGARMELGLREDSAEDEEQRALPVDGVGRRLEVVDVIAAGKLADVEPASLPQVRPGTGDAPAPGWLRLTWSWRGKDALTESQLRSRLRTGFVVESVQTIEADPATLTWSALAAGEWIEEGRARRALARVPLRIGVLDLLRGATAGGEEAVAAHASGTVRAIALLVPQLRAGTGTR